MGKREDKTFEKRDELINFAIGEFGEKGYDNASLNNILKKAGISKGTFYYHFKNKEELYTYLIGILIEEKLKFFNENVNPMDFKKDIFTLLNILTKTGLEFAMTNPEINKFSETFFKEKNSEINKRVLKKFDMRSNNFYDDLIENAYNKGEIREDLPKTFVKNIVSYLFTNLDQIMNITKVDEYDKAADNLIKFMKGGLSKK